MVQSAFGRMPRAIFYGIEGAKEEQSLPTQGPEVGQDGQVWARGAGVRMHGFPPGCSTSCWNYYARCLQLIFNLQSKTNLH